MSAEIERIEDLLGESPPGGARAAGTPGERTAASEGLSPEYIQRHVTAVTLVVLAGLALGVFGLLVTKSGSDSLGWLLVAIALLTGVFVLYRKFEIGIVVFLGICWMAIGTPALSTGGSGFEQRLLVSQIGLALLLMVWVTRVFVRGEFTLYATPMNVPIALYLFICIWSTVNSFIFPDPNVTEYAYRQYAQVNYYENLTRILSLGGLLMIANSLRGRALFWASVAVVAPGILTFANLLPFVPASAYLAFPQILAMAFLASLVLTKQGPVWVRIIAGILVACIVGAYFIKGAEWVSGWVGALVALGIITFLTNRRLFWSICAVLVVIVLIRWGYFYEKIYLSNFEAGTLHTDRGDMLRASFMYAAHFPLGVGLGNYRSYNNYYGRAEVWNTTTFTSAHGTYAQTLSETGWPGFLALILLLVASTRMLYRYYKAFPPGYTKSYLLAALGGSVGIYVASFNGDYLFPTYHNGGIGSFGSAVYVFFFIGIAIAFARQQGIVWTATRDLVRAREKAERPRPAPIYNRGPYANPGAAARRVESR